MSERSDIRNAIKTLLAGATLAAGRVFVRRSKPFRQAELPCINVYISDEPIGEDSKVTAPRRLERNAVVNIDYFCATHEDEEALEQQLDDACWKEDATQPGSLIPDPATPGIESVMDAKLIAEESGIAVRDCILTSTEVGIVINGNTPLGCVHLEFSVQYRTAVRTRPATDKFDQVELSVKTGTQVHTNLRTGINQEP